MILPSIVMAASFPTLVRAHDQDSSLRRRSELGLGTALLGLGIMVGGAVYLASGLAIHAAFGPAFANAVPALRVLAFAVPILFLNYGLTHFLIARRLERYNLAFTIVMVVLNLGSNLMLIPRFAGLGAAWTTVGTEVLLTACCLLTLGWAPRASAYPSQPPEARSATSRVRTSE
jgi:O-antigen/teichoic acid export membrane protein